MALVRRPQKEAEGRGASPPKEVLANLLSRYLDRNRDFYREEFLEALSAGA